MKRNQFSAVVMYTIFGAQFVACDQPASDGAETQAEQATSAPDLGTIEASAPDTLGENNGSTDSGKDGGSTAETADTTGGEEMPDDSDDINAYILGLGHLTVDPPAPAMQKLCEGEGCLQDGEQDGYFCAYTYYTVTENYDEFVAFQPNSATLWPGSIVAGEDASHGLLTAIGLPRAPLTFSVSLPGIVGSSAGHLDAPTLSSYRDELKQILANGVVGSTPASLSFELRQVFSAADLSLALKTSVSWPGGSNINAMFDLATEQTKTRIVANFVQSYYTVDMDTPLQPASLFAPEVTTEQLGDFMGVENPPMYVQSLTYGRRAVFSIESSYSAEELRSALDLSIKAATIIDGMVDAKSQKVLSESTMKVFVQGGGSDDGINAVDGFQGLMTFIKKGAEFSADSPAALIAYKLAYLDNYGTRFAYTTDFAEAECSLVPVDKIRVFVDKIYFHRNGCGAADPKCNNTYEVWAVTNTGEQCDLAAQLNPSYIKDETTIHIGKSCDLEVPDAPGSEVTVQFTAHEDDKGVSAKKDFTYQDGWVGLGEHGITGKNTSGKDLDVSVFFQISEK